jgi:hypothetical protein
MRTSRIIPAAFVASALSAPAHAAPTCLLEVAGQRYIDGPCDAFRTSDGHLIISVGSGNSRLLASRPRQLPTKLSL